MDARNHVVVKWPTSGLVEVYKRTRGDMRRRGLRCTPSGRLHAGCFFLSFFPWVVNSRLICPRVSPGLPLVLKPKRSQVVVVVLPKYGFFGGRGRCPVKSATLRL